jgi:hypothetical protein
MLPKWEASVINTKRSLLIEGLDAWVFSWGPLLSKTAVIDSLGIAIIG